MSEPEYPNVADTHVAHEGQVDEAIDAQMRRTSDEPAVAGVTPLVAATPVTPLGTATQTYDDADTQAAFDAINDLITQITGIETHLIALEGKVNSALTVLREAELIPAS